MSQNKIVVSILFITLLSCTNLWGQNTASRLDIIERIIENIAESTDEEIDYNRFSRKV